MSTQHTTLPQLHTPPITSSPESNNDLKTLVKHSTRGHFRLFSLTVMNTDYYVIGGCALLLIFPYFFFISFSLSVRVVFFVATQNHFVLQLIK